MKIRRIKNTAEKFRNRIAKMQTDNRGLTLIELIITVAIIAIFSGVVSLAGSRFIVSLSHFI